MVPMLEGDAQSVYMSIVAMNFYMFRILIYLLIYLITIYSFAYLFVYLPVILLKFCCFTLLYSKETGGLIRREAGIHIHLITVWICVVTVTRKQCLLKGILCVSKPNFFVSHLLVERVRYFLERNNMPGIVNKGILYISQKNELISKLIIFFPFGGGEGFGVGKIQ